MRSSRPALAPPAAPASPSKPTSQSPSSNGNASPYSSSSIRPTPTPSLPTLATSPLVAVASFSSSSRLSKKPKPSKKASKSTTESSAHTPKNSEPYSSIHTEADDTLSPSDKGHPAPSPSDLSDFPDLTSRFNKASEQFNTLLRKLRSGQTSLAVESISHLRVCPDKKTAPNETFPLRELATVVPRSGRTVSILVHDPSYTKGIMSAVQASPLYNQQPQKSPDNELELTMKMAKESPAEIAGRVKEAAHAYKEAVRMARQKRDKQHQLWVKDGTWVSDVKFKADGELKKKVDKKNAEIAKLEQQTLKSLASNWE
ncbi:hypothetical protein MKZ38_004584 [Zalerion maritima]|uniref:Ribosome recycling factor domain-containing protein n=1 Tax=Zalerion maritima TaxID=339359 RepID=A0AAD5RXW1_9PEZI|nr:hypothetical protein MKZ38_004584 [Zalerion maritima]